jgi:hypothetical protein
MTVRLNVRGFHILVTPKHMGKPMKQMNNDTSAPCRMVA